ncbi:MAG: tRNA-specific adenosine deaminase [Rhodobiaceae bacterium]|mgnify:FL=1|jgi:tRNA(adenine34) deaminase|nr:tRNA-specific adenosine deaminase [Rhodobiaceae bacterium]OUT93491.1 MAG: tRNA-specific adenosine deaminase [Rhizobiales bacterium TMED29]
MSAPDYMAMALAEAEAAAQADEVPVGAVIVAADGSVLARTGNAMRRTNDPTAHAEILALRAACATLGTDRLPDCDLYVTLEPCTMCAGAISHARIRRLYYGASDRKAGAVDNGVAFFDQPTCHHKPEVYGGIQEKAAARLLKDFFALRRYEQFF